MTYNGFFMQPFKLKKYAFRIRTRVGMVVDNLMIPGETEEEAGRKLRQIYRDCQILNCVCHHGSVRTPVAGNFEDIVSLIAR
jgi:hypothetical protein